MGLVHIYCGDGKGKTSAAVGLAVRAAGCGKRVVIARFLKTDNSGEVEILKKIPEVTLIPCRKTFGFVRSMDEETKRECAAYHRELFGEAVKLAEHADLVVFDEIMAAVNYGMVPERDVLEFLENRPGRDQTDGLEIVLTTDRFFFKVAILSIDFMAVYWYPIKNGSRDRKEPLQETAGCRK